MSTSLKYCRGPVGAWLEVSDEDSADFLQSQFSNDLQAGPGQATYGLWLDHRGRIHGDSTVLQVEPERFFIYSAATDGNALREKLESHVVADDVALTDRSGEVVCLVIWGAGIEEALSGSHLALPAADRYAASEALWLFPAHAAPPGAWQVIGPLAAVEDLAEKLRASGAAETDTDALHFSRIQSGVPLIPLEIGPGETPLDAGLEAACSLRKGCFLGQEVVARQHRLGRRSRVLVRVRIEGVLPDLPAPLLVEGAEVGSLRAAARKDGQTLGLALLKRRIHESANDLKICVGTEDTEVFVEPGK